jgi:ankyrin repeat protein
MNSKFIHSLKTKNDKMAIAIVKNAKDINYISNEFTFPALHAAIIYDRPDVVEEILKRDDLDINRRDYVTDAAIHKASVRGNDKIFKMLLDRDGIDINVLNRYQESAFYFAVYRGHLNIVKMLVNDNRLIYNNSRNVLKLSEVFNTLR